MSQGVLAALVVVGVLASACTQGAVQPTPPGTVTAADAPSSAVPSPVAPSPTPTPLPTPDAAVAVDLPEPDERIPLRVAALVRELERTRQARRTAVMRWVRSGGAAEWPPPEDVVLLVLHEQRIYRALAARARLAERVLARVDGPLSREAGANVRAGRALYEHFTPVKEVPDFRIQAPEPADALLGYFARAEERFGVDWEVLAAVMLIETRMGRIVSNSSAGAQGPMQFIPSTWAAYGLGGDVREERDAVIGAANYLRAFGAPSDYRQALFHYNPVGAYVSAVTQYAKAIRRDPDLFYTYYNWQVFVRTTRGDVRLSGPGL